MKYAQLIKAIDSTSQKLLGHAATVVNQSLVMRNWLVGAYIVEFEQNGEDRAKYGTRLLPRLAGDLKKRGVNGVSPDMLERMRQFYFVYPQAGSDISAPLVRKLTIPLLGAVRTGISAPLVRKSSGGIQPLSANAIFRFSWTQLIELIRIEDPLKRAFYENECLKGNWSKRQLQRQIGSLLYERTGLSTDKTAVVRRAHRQEPQATIADLIRDPYILEFAGLAEVPRYNESDLEQALLDHLQQFLLELGTGFCFEARQLRVTIGNEHDYIDLVFYHRVLRCHVLLDLKVRPFKHGDAGQMNYYLNYFKQRIMRDGDHPPVGIILCSDRENTKVEFATSGMDNKLFVSRYLVSLPTVAQLEAFIANDRAQVEVLIDQMRRQVPKKPTRKRKVNRILLTGSDKVIKDRQN
ncbi:MAG: PDDEXK nuclease domain-containing protein [Verrucomicrobiota bacterium]